MGKKSYSRITGRPRQKRQKRQALIAVGLLLMALAAALLFAWPRDGHVDDVKASVDSASMDPASLSVPADPTPCPYCNQQAESWRSQTTVPPPEIGGASAAIIEGSCAQLLYGKDESRRRSPASLTKIVTALVVVEQARLEDRITVEVNGWELSAEDDSTIMGLEAGMNLSVNELLYGLLLPSGNDAALALAASLGGEKTFVGLMNQRVRRLGLKNTRFVNPDGRDAENQFSSAFDMALLGRELMQNVRLREIVSTISFMPAWDRHLLWNNNYLLQYYPGATGVKTGYTEGANYTIVASAERDGRELYVSVLDTKNLYLDAANLLDWAFTNTRPAC